jgi:hypothetical protein
MKEVIIQWDGSSAGCTHAQCNLLRRAEDAVGVLCSGLTARPPATVGLPAGGCRVAYMAGAPAMQACGPAHTHLVCFVHVSSHQVRDLSLQLPVGEWVSGKSMSKSCITSC